MWIFGKFHRWLFSSGKTVRLIVFKVLLSYPDLCQNCTELFGPDSGFNSTDSTMPTSTIMLEGFIPAEKTGSYLHLPFEVPPGTGRIDIHYSYDSAIGAEPQYSGGNTIDIGLFDERGPVEGFRGWS